MEQSLSFILLYWKFVYWINNKLHLRIIVFILVLVSLLFIQSENSKKVFLYDSDGRKIEVVIIDAGHGGKDPGAIGVSGIHEKNINLAISLKLMEPHQRIWWPWSCFDSWYGWIYRIESAREDC